MTQTFYVPGTEETDPKKIILSLQQIAAYLTRAQFNFPATAVDSTDPNTLDDYEEGTWTPSLTFETPGDLAITYSSQTGKYTKIGNRVFFDLVMVTTAFTHTTASGNLFIGGLPFAPALLGGNNQRCGQVFYEGITKAGFSDYIFITQSATQLRVTAMQSGGAPSNVTASDMPTGGTVQIRGNGMYFV